MLENQQYISCIKVGGKPIIPPLITPKRREECLSYKMQAIELEKKMERNRVFKKCLDDITKLEDDTKQLSKNVEHTQTLESQLAFAEDNWSSPTHVPYITYKKLQNLKSETIDVSEYSDDGVKVLSNSPVKSPPPKLIRSNSYTLDNPSPILLAHLEKEARKCVELSESSSESDSLSPATVIDSELEPRTFVETEVQMEEVTVSTGPPNRVESQLAEALGRLPADHADKILKLLETQDLEERPTSVSISSQSLYYTLSSPETTPDVHLVNLRNLRKNESEARRHWAASVIGAAAKGYLVRRLITTDRVQSLIDTIKDALVCAIELHGSEIIEEADVELHRRLIQQVSAACYAFHDVFFAISIKEQMNIISHDRQRKREKANRPLSSSSSSISIQRRRSSKAIR